MAKHERSEQTAERILDVAISLWAQKGYTGMTMRELATRAGVGTGTLYFHFSSKEELVLALYERVNLATIERFRAEAGASTDLGEELARFLRVKLELLRPHRAALPVILREAVDPDSPLSPLSQASSPTRERSLALFSEMLDRARSVPGERRESTARALWMLHLGVLLFWLHDRSPGRTRTDDLIGAVSRMARWIARLDRLGLAERVGRFVAALFEPTEDSVSAQTAGSIEPGGAPIREVDVIVIGGGPLGCLAASFLQRRRPGTRVLVLERSLEPQHKIGESTLSGFCKALRTIGIRQDALQRLFFIKNGLGFFHVDRSNKDLRQAPEYILETFDETFQVERRVLDTLVLAAARRAGVEVQQGARVSIETSDLSPHGNRIHYRIGSREYRVAAPLVIDASGPARLIATSRDLWTDEGVTFQTSAGWSYWSGVKPLAEYGGWPSHARFPRDEYTQHLCFPEGWLWMIPLVSWQQSPTANLQRMVDRVMTAARTPDRAALEAEHGCPSDRLTSIGLVLRDDRDRTLKQDPREALERFRRRYPAIDQLLDGARHDAVYGGDEPTFGQRLAMRGHARQIVGDGWLLVGDAAFFVDPLISPGLTAGAAMAYRAAEVAARALDGGDMSAESLADYESYGRDLHQALERDNQLVYMSFNHPRALAQIQRFQEVDARRHFVAHERADYGPDDCNVWGILTSTYQDYQRRAWELMHEAEETVGKRLSVDEQSAADYEPMVAALDELLHEYLESNVSLTPYAQRNPG